MKDKELRKRFDIWMKTTNTNNENYDHLIIELSKQMYALECKVANKFSTLIHYLNLEYIDTPAKKEFKKRK